MEGWGGVRGDWGELEKEKEKGREGKGREGSMEFCSQQCCVACMYCM